MSNEHLSSYPSIYTLGHRYLNALLDGPVVVEEKVDGSQFSMARNLDGSLSVRSKGQEIHLGAVPQLFNQAVAVASSLDLHPGWVYRGEYLQKPKHNTLCYSRVPKKLLDAPQDIGPLLVDLQADLVREEGEFIKQRLYDHFIKQVCRGVTAGFPEFYKVHLAEKTQMADPNVFTGHE
jgi:hypothetical protein